MSPFQSANDWLATVPLAFVHRNSRRFRVRRHSDYSSASVRLIQSLGAHAGRGKAEAALRVCPTGRITRSTNAARGRSVRRRIRYVIGWCGAIALRDAAVAVGTGAQREAHRRAAIHDPFSAMRPRAWLDPANKVCDISRCRASRLKHSARLHPAMGALKLTFDPSGH